MNPRHFEDFESALSGRLVHVYTRAKGVFRPEDPENPLVRIRFVPWVSYLFAGTYAGEPKRGIYAMACLDIPRSRTEDHVLFMGTLHRRRNRVVFRAACEPGPGGMRYFAKPLDFTVGRIQPRPPRPPRPRRPRRPPRPP